MVAPQNGGPSEGRTDTLFHVQKMSAATDLAQTPSASDLIGSSR